MIDEGIFGLICVFGLYSLIQKITRFLTRGEHE